MRGHSITAYTGRLPPRKGYLFQAETGAGGGLGKSVISVCKKAQRA